MEIGTYMYGRKTIWRHTWRRWPCDWSDTSMSQGMPRIVSKHKQLQDARKDSPLETCWCLDFILLVSRTMRQWISVVLSHPVFGICYGSPRKLIQWPCVQVLLIKKKGTTNNFCHWPEKAVQISFNKYLLSAYCICYPMGNQWWVKLMRFLPSWSFRFHDEAGTNYSHRYLIINCGVCVLGRNMTGCRTWGLRYKFW